mmetsp:Transcript_22416/g.34676  ORF Transcript_22416/g.34676 Transcript_22416/m.34676 type:complete len:85 (+) Transcript_22416:499-753(+)
MMPLLPHLPPPPEIEFGTFFGGIGDMLRNKLESIKKTGPVQHHPLPSNFLRPGAHPAHKKPEEKKKEEKKDDEPKQSLKPIKIE